jgi:hypothetical protein
MKSSNLFFPLLGKSLIILAGSLALTAWAEDIGQIKTTKGSAHIERAGAKLPAQVGLKVQQTDTVVTGADGTVGIAFVDNSTVSAGPNSILVIERFAFDTTTYQGAFDASLKQGTLSVVSGKIAKQSPDAMKIRTPAAILGVRGTEFVVRAQENANKHAD